MNLAYSIIQWIVTLIAGPLLSGLYFFYFKGDKEMLIDGLPLYLLILFVSFLTTLPAIVLHILFNWMCFKFRLPALAFKLAMSLFTMLMIIVVLVAFFDFDMDSPFLIGYCVAAFVSGMFLPVTENEKTVDHT